MERGKMLTDTHAHLDDEKLRSNLDAVLSRARDRGMGFYPEPGLRLRNERGGCRAVEQYPEVYAAVGFHPMDADRFDGEPALNPGFVNGRLCRRPLRSVRSDWTTLSR